jgi:hypothetical protein
MDEFITNLKKISFGNIEDYCFDNKEKIKYLMKIEKDFEKTVKGTLIEKVKIFAREKIKEGIKKNEYFDHYVEGSKAKVLEYAIGKKLVPKNLLEDIVFDHGESPEIFKKNLDSNFIPNLYSQIVKPKNNSLKNRSSIGSSYCC